MSDGKDEKTRINRVITRSGDDGRTGLADGSRIAKDHPRIQALGALDELNSGLGVLRARALDDDLDTPAAVAAIDEAVTAGEDVAEATDLLGVVLDGTG